MNITLACINNNKGFNLYNNNNFIYFFRWISTAEITLITPSVEKDPSKKMDVFQNGNSSEGKMWSPLQIAILRYLFQNRNNTTIGWSPLHSAILSGDVQMAKYLIENSADLTGILMYNTIYE